MDVPMEIELIGLKFRLKQLEAEMRATRRAAAVAILIVLVFSLIYWGLVAYSLSLP